MKFVIEYVSKSSGRLGYLVQTETSKKFKTPLLLQTTKGGSIPYLSREVFEYVTKDTQVLQIPLATVDQMAESLKLFESNFGSYVGFKNYPTVLLIRDPSEVIPSGFNDRDIVPMFTRRGKEHLSGTKYMDLVEAFQPDIYQGLNDADTNQDSAKKRVQKSVDRTNQFMDYCYERHRKSDRLKRAALFVPIVGGYNKFARSNSIKHAQENSGASCAGYVLEGFHNYGITATETHEANLVDVVTHCIKELDADKPKMMPGSYTPLVILQMISLGVDIFDTSYAYCAAANFKALSFNFNLHPVEIEKTSSCSSAFIDVTDESMKEDFLPLLNGCTCLTCRKHTRAYLHHLYVTRELLGPILLMIHNLHHYLEYFEAIRHCIKNDSLPELIKLIKYQYSDKNEVDYRIYKHDKQIKKAVFGEGFATAK